MSDHLLKANLNLFAVLQNLEELVQLDPKMAELTRDWNVVIQFIVSGGPKAYLAFDRGVCTHGRGRHDRPSVKLWFPSPAHLNAMFDGNGNPIPLKGFTKLGFLKNEFSKLTDRLEYFLKPTPELLEDEAYVHINTTLALQAGAFAVPELAQLDPTCRAVADRIPAGALQFEVLPDGPFVHIVFDNHGTATAKKGRADKPMAVMTFKTTQTANDLVNGRLDSFLAVTEGSVTLWGRLDMVDNMSLILDRVGDYLA